MAFSFGAPAAKPATTFAGFGTPASAPAPASTGLFGSTAPASGGLFGSAAPASGGLFGAASAAPASGGLFGAPAPATSTPGLFGAAPAAAAPTTGLFGAPATSAAPTSLFGAPAASQPGAAPSLFGAAPAAQGGGLFGASQPAASTSLFGAAPPAGGNSLFGASQPAQQQQQPAVTAAPLFGQSQSAASASLFGSKPAGGASLFGASTSLAQSQQQPQQQQQQPLPKLGEPYPPPNPNEPSIEARIETIKSAWDPQDPKCRFQTYFYNEPTAPNSVKSYGRPPTGTDEKAWNKAVRENPDPERLVPAIAIGFPALQSRLQHQSTQTASHQALLSEIHLHLTDLSSTHSLTTTLRTLRASQNATALSSRLLALVARLSPLTTGRNNSVRKEEDQLRVKLEEMGKEVERGAGRANELWGGVAGVKQRALQAENEGWAVVDEEGLNQVLEILASQQAGLDHLSKTLNAAKGDVEVMNEAFGIGAKRSS